MERKKKPEIIDDKSNIKSKDKKTQIQGQSFYFQN